MNILLPSLWLLVFIQMEILTASSICSHKYPRFDEVLHVHLESKHVIQKRSTDQPLRIKVFYDESLKALDQEKHSIITKTVIPQALDYWSRALLVKPLRVPIRLSRACPSPERKLLPSRGPNGEEQYIPHCAANYCMPITKCGEAIVPEAHLDVCRSCDLKGCRADSTGRGEGVLDADFVLYVSSTQTSRCEKGTTVAYAAHCAQESSLDRPIAGHANLCPDSISTKTQDLATMLSTVKHEILHALGFSVSLYGYYRDKAGRPLSRRDLNGRPYIKRDELTNGVPEWSDRVIKKISRPWSVRTGTLNKDAYFIVTPRVKAEVQRHFNCSTIEGAELEDQGADGTLLTHWEKRVFENEAMTGTHTQNPVYSRITLALMEDTGWYQPNYSLAQPLAWGNNLGCDFSMKSCGQWIERKRQAGEPIYPFCDKVKTKELHTDCTENRDAVAVCNLISYQEDLPEIYQNFDHIPGISEKASSKYGGSVYLADYCPFVQEFTWKANDSILRGSHCGFSENTPEWGKNFALEYYGNSSKCFHHSREMWQERTCRDIRQWQHWGSGCYKYMCFDGRLHLDIANRTYTCRFTDQELQIQLLVDDWLHIGTIVCPPCSEICQEHRMPCKPDDNSHYKSLEYYKDLLTCSGLSVSASGLTLLSLILYYLTAS